jgi:hypothetical protein
MLFLLFVSDTFNNRIDGKACNLLPLSSLIHNMKEPESIDGNAIGTASSFSLKLILCILSRCLSTDRKNIIYLANFYPQMNFSLPKKNTGK